ncbi:hypothetical protein B0H16DRAFT_1700427 [Mycena metata]|uniref:Uncharacterized protein n=1 Tax=Mycena metata TaxID=1033252 RepID=A0AAD7HEQ4_9AGAR|nr:hypothetical protein B0H16DRAFT_1700427 [Mycena metata]
MPAHVPHGKIGTTTAIRQPGYNTGAQRTRPFSTGDGNGLRSGQAKPQILHGGQSQDQLRSHTVWIAHLATSDASYPPHCNASQNDERFKLEDLTKTVEDLETRRESRMVLEILRGEKVSGEGRGKDLSKSSPRTIEDRADAWKRTGGTWKLEGLAATARVTLRRSEGGEGGNMKHLRLEKPGAGTAAIVLRTKTLKDALPKTKDGSQRPRRSKMVYKDDNEEDTARDRAITQRICEGVSPADAPSAFLSPLDITARTIAHTGTLLADENLSGFFDEDVRPDPHFLVDMEHAIAAEENLGPNTLFHAPEQEQRDFEHARQASLAQAAAAAVAAATTPLVAIVNPAPPPLLRRPLPLVRMTGETELTPKHLVPLAGAAPAPESVLAPAPQHLQPAVPVANPCTYDGQALRIFVTQGPFPETTADPVARLRNVDTSQVATWHNTPGTILAVVSGGTVNPVSESQDGADLISGSTNVPCELIRMGLANAANPRLPAPNSSGFLGNIEGLTFPNTPAGAQEAANMITQTLSTTPAFIQLVMNHRDNLPGHWSIEQALTAIHGSITVSPIDLLSPRGPRVVWHVYMMVTTRDATAYTAIRAAFAPILFVTAFNNTGRAGWALPQPHSSPPHLQRAADADAEMAVAGLVGAGVVMEAVEINYSPGLFLDKSLYAYHLVLSQDKEVSEKYYELKSARVRRKSQEDVAATTNNHFNLLDIEDFDTGTGSSLDLSGGANGSAIGRGPDDGGGEIGDGRTNGRAEEVRRSRRLATRGGNPSNRNAAAGQPQPHNNPRPARQDRGITSGSTRTQPTVQARPPRRTPRPPSPATESTVSNNGSSASANNRRRRGGRHSMASTIQPRAGKYRHPERDSRESTSQPMTRQRQPSSTTRGNCNKSGILKSRGKQGLK